MTAVVSSSEAKEMMESFMSLAGLGKGSSALVLVEVGGKTFDSGQV